MTKKQLIRIMMRSARGCYLKKHLCSICLKPIWQPCYLVHIYTPIMKGPQFKLLIDKTINIMQDMHIWVNKLQVKTINLSILKRTILLPNITTKCYHRMMAIQNINTSMNRRRAILKCLMNMTNKYSSDNLVLPNQIQNIWTNALRWRRHRHSNNKFWPNFKVWRDS